MDRLAANLIQDLSQVRWTPSQGTSVLLSQLGYEHGFWGKTAPSIDEIKPHHVKQVHGRCVGEASEQDIFTANPRIEADGIFSTKNDVLAVKTADCLPVLVASDKFSIVMAIHAGWRGLTAGILLEGLKIAQIHTQTANLKFIIGPAISREAFEVGPEVVEALGKKSCGLPELFLAFAVSKGKKDRWHVDLQVAAALQLIAAGVRPQNIEVMRCCTKSDMAEAPEGTLNDREFSWHSYRRDGKSCGSNWAWIRGQTGKP